LKRIFALFTIMLLSLFVFSITTFSAPNDGTKWKDFDEKTNVDVKKVWTITFSGALDKKAVTTQHIYVENSSYQRVPVQLELNSDGKTVRVLPPSSGYTPGETYTLYMTNSVMSAGQQGLTEPVRMRFTIKENQQEVPFVERTNSLNEMAVAPTIIDIAEGVSFSVELNQVIMQKPSNVTLQPGDIFYLPPTDAFPFGQFKKVGTLKEAAGQLVIQTTEPAADEILEHLDISQKIAVSAKNVQVNPELAGIPKNVASTQAVAQASPIKVIDNESGGIDILIEGLVIEDTIRVDGTLKLKKPEVIVDVETPKKGALKFNRLDFSAEEELYLQVTSTLSREKSVKEWIATFPVPFAGLPKAGLNINLFVVFNAKGEAELVYEFEQSLDVQVGVVRDEQTGGLSTIKQIDFEAGTKDIKLEGDIELRGGVNTAVGMVLGNISLVGVDLTVELGNRIQGKLVSFQENDYKVCYRVAQTIHTAGDFTLGDKIETKWFDIDAEYRKELFRNSNDIGAFGNCSFSSIKIHPTPTVIYAGEEVNLRVTGVTETKDRTIEEMVIPNQYVTFTSSDKTSIAVTSAGKMTVQETAIDQKQVTISASYKDPLTGGKVENSFVVTVNKRDENIEDIKKMTNDYSLKLEKILWDSSQASVSFEKIRPQLLNYATKKYTDGEIKERYLKKKPGGPGPYGMLPYFVGELDARFDVLENTPNRIKIQTAMFYGSYTDGTDVFYTFIEEDGNWKIDEVISSRIGKGSLHVTKEEALAFMKGNYIYRGHKQVAVTYVKSGTKYRNIYGDGGVEVRKCTYYVLKVKTEQGTYEQFVFENDGNHGDTDDLSFYKDA